MGFTGLYAWLYNIRLRLEKLLHRAETRGKAQMTDLYFVLAATLATWLGLFLYILRVDLKIREAERREKYDRAVLVLLLLVLQQV